MDTTYGRRIRMYLLSRRRQRLERDLWIRGDGQFNAGLPLGNTSVGPIDHGPKLSHRRQHHAGIASPMFLWWGDDLIQFYNDAYRPSIREDKHPRALGQPAKECWQEIWHIIGPQIDAVMTRGEASWHENQLVPINPHRKLEDVYWTYGYSPVRDSRGNIRATLVVCTETTESVLAKRQLELETSALRSCSNRLRRFSPPSADPTTGSNW